MQVGLMHHHKMKMEMLKIDKRTCFVCILFHLYTIRKILIWTTTIDRTWVNI
jgi:hypothetical protein